VRIWKEPESDLATADVVFESKAITPATTGLTPLGLIQKPSRMVRGELRQALVTLNSLFDRSETTTNRLTGTSQ
jgi:hypothetical protein